jgi:hypothetical protein
MSSDTNQSDPRGLAHIDAVRRFYELLHRKDIDAWGELWHEGGVIIVPYPPEGFPTRIEGKDEILPGFRGLLGNFESFESEITGIYPAADSDAVCVEYRNRATLIGGASTQTRTSRSSASATDSSPSTTITSIRGASRSWSMPCPTLEASCFRVRPKGSARCPPRSSRPTGDAPGAVPMQQPELSVRVDATELRPQRKSRVTRPGCPEPPANKSW